MCNTKVKLKIEQDGVGYVAESDWINFVDETCWIQASYRSNKNFAGIIYETGEDYGEYFYARFPVQFFHQDNPQESVTVELSSSEVVTTATNLKERRRLLSDFMPDYMHKKLQLILAHAANGEVIIDGDYWSIQDAYEREDPPDVNYPMKSATTYLTKKNFYLRNIT